MRGMLISVLSLFIALHGFLLIIGGPRAVKGMYRLLARSIFPFPRRGSREVTNGLLNVLATAIRFVFDRPRR